MMAEPSWEARMPSRAADTEYDAAIANNTEERRSGMCIMMSVEQLQYRATTC